MRGNLSEIVLKGMCTTVPKNYVNNKEFVNIMPPKELNKQIFVTGIEKRHLVTGQQTSADLCTVAAERLLTQLNWQPDSVRVIIYVTQTPDLERPSTAFVIQKRLGIGKDCLVYDMNLGCSGYIGGLITIGSILQSCGGRGLLLVGIGSSLVQREEQSTTLLMGDAGTATALETLDVGSIIPYRMQSDGSGYKVLIKETGKPAKMNAPAVFSFAINEVTETIQEFIKENELTDEMIDYYVFHQAQKLIVDNMIDICNIPREKVLFSMKEYGNTDGASIPLTICKNRAQLQRNESVRLLLCGFGIGLSWGCAYVKMNTDNIMDVIETEKCFILEGKK